MSNNHFTNVMPEDYIKKVAQNLNIPPYVDIEVNEFVRQVLQSLSLNFTAKNDVFKSVPKLVQGQFDALKSTFDEEKHEMIRQYDKYPEQIATLVGYNIIQAIVVGVFIDVLKADEDIEYLGFKILKKLRRDQPKLYELGQEISKHSENWQYLIGLYERYKINKMSMELEWLDDLV